MFWEPFRVSPEEEEGNDANPDMIKEIINQTLIEGIFKHLDERPNEKLLIRKYRTLLYMVPVRNKEIEISTKT